MNFLEMSKKFSSSKKKSLGVWRTTTGICSARLSKIICLRYAFATCKLHRTVCFCAIQYILPAKVVLPCFFEVLHHNMASFSVYSRTFSRILVIFQLLRQSSALVSSNCRYKINGTVQNLDSGLDWTVDWTVDWNLDCAVRDNYIE